MKRYFLPALVAFAFSGFAQQKDYQIKSVPFTNVKVSDQFWAPRIEINRTVTIPASFERCENTGRVKNFVMAGQRSGKFCTTFPFDDTDIYKTIEGASYSLAVLPDQRLDHYLDSLIQIIGKAQEADGYLYTARTIDPLHPHAWAGPERWVREHELSHELYNSGHMFEAAVAHYQATGKKNFLNIALKNANLLVRTFGPDKRHVAPGHEIVEMGLVKLYRVTGNKDYLNLAQFFIDERGKRKYNSKSKDSWENGNYWQDGRPLVDENEALGHAVRAMYLYSAVADVAALEGNQAYVKAIDRIWENMVGKKLYVQGGIGAIPDGEQFGANYQLPNATAYNETCAAIGNVFWNQRMFLLHGDSKYVDILEKSLYNGLISGVGLDGKSFFYTNAMEVKNAWNYSRLEAERSGWFECSCCPTNLVRLLPSLPGYIYAQTDEAIYVNLFVSGAADLRMNGVPVKITQQNNYPWDGGLLFTVNPAKSKQFTMKIRIPGWARNKAVPTDLYNFEDTVSSATIVRVNGKIVNYTMDKGYAVINRTWKRNDKIEVVLPMSVRRVIANENVADDNGKVALQRGPIIYCAEWKDNGGKTSGIILPDDSPLTSEFRRDLLKGIEVVKGDVVSVNVSDDGKTVTSEKRTLTAIPYYSWANRGKGEMTVWFPRKIKNVDLLTK